MSKEKYSTKSSKELKTLLSEKKTALGKLVFIKGDPSQKSDSSAIKLLKKDIARIQTVLNQLS